jgi:hypothetical protein
MVERPTKQTREGSYMKFNFEKKKVLRFVNRNGLNIFCVFLVLSGIPSCVKTFEEKGRYEAAVSEDRLQQSLLPVGNKRIKSCQPIIRVRGKKVFVQNLTEETVVSTLADGSTVCDLAGRTGKIIDGQVSKIAPYDLDKVEQVEKIFSKATKNARVYRENSRVETLEAELEEDKAKAPRASKPNKLAEPVETEAEETGEDNLQFILNKN